MITDDPYYNSSCMLSLSNLQLLYSLLLKQYLSIAVYKLLSISINYLGVPKSSGGGTLFSYRKLEEIFFFMG